MIKIIKHIMQHMKQAKVVNIHLIYLINMDLKQPVKQKMI